MRRRNSCYEPKSPLPLDRVDVQRMDAQQRKVKLFKIFVGISVLAVFLTIQVFSDSKSEEVREDPIPFESTDLSASESEHTSPPKRQENSGTKPGVQSGEPKLNIHKRPPKPPAPPMPPIFKSAHISQAKHPVLDLPPLQPMKQHHREQPSPPPPPPPPRPPPPPPPQQPPSKSSLPLPSLEPEPQVSSESPPASPPPAALSPSKLSKSPPPSPPNKSQPVALLKQKLQPEQSTPSLPNPPKKQPLSNPPKKQPLSNPPKKQPLSNPRKKQPKPVTAAPAITSRQNHGMDHNPVLEAIQRREAMELQHRQMMEAHRAQRQEMLRQQQLHKQALKQHTWSKHPGMALKIPEAPVDHHTGRWARAREHEQVVSTGKTVIASAYGDKGHVSVITSPSIVNWKTDRWGVSNMYDATRAWVEIDLGSPHFLSSVRVVWEAAFAQRYVIETKIRPSDERWTRLFDISGATPFSKTGRMRIRGEVNKLPTVTDHIIVTGDIAARYVRLRVQELATKWGVSIWYLELKGVRGVVN